MTEGLGYTREALRLRQGGGARYDATNAPAQALDWVRRGTAYFARLLNSLTDDELDGPSLVAGLRRREIIAHVGYHARVLSEIVATARMGLGHSVQSFALIDDAELRRRATQPAYALRNLVAHSTVHLNVEWRDLDDSQWDLILPDAADTIFTLRETPRLRAEVLWLCAIDLNAGGRAEDVPADILATERYTAWTVAATYLKPNLGANRHAWPKWRP
ncbi:maleylpyruvate isomerase N-terminal domain-containing protein [Agrobacterium salinitolerans]